MNLVRVTSLVMYFLGSGESSATDASRKRVSTVVFGFQLSSDDLSCDCLNALLALSSVPQSSKRSIFNQGGECDESQKKTSQ